MHPSRFPYSAWQRLWQEGRLGLVRLKELEWRGAQFESGGQATIYLNSKQHSVM